MVERKLAPAGAHALIAEGRLLGLAALYRTREGAVQPGRPGHRRADGQTGGAGRGQRPALHPGAGGGPAAAAQSGSRRAADTRTVHTAEGHLQDIGNAWCEVIPLSGARTALVIGDVAEPGVRGIALMGRLRAGLLALAEQDPEPGELLSRLATLTARLARDVHLGLRAPEPLSTCLYLVYDPVEHTCQAASPAPRAPGRPGRRPDAHRAAGMGLRWAPTAMPTRPAVSPSPTRARSRCSPAVSPLWPRTAPRTAAPTAPPPCARRSRTPGAAWRNAATRRSAGSSAAGRPATPCCCWPAPGRCRPSRRHLGAVRLARQVASARRSCAEQLTRWGLGDLAFTTELLVSELVTNAIRHGSAPVRLRLIRDRALVCEVHDASSSAPRVCHATGNDEGAGDCS